MTMLYGDVLYKSIQEPPPVPESLRPEDSHLPAWGQQSPAIVWPLRSPVNEGFFAPDPARLLDQEDPMLKWYMPTEQPYPVVRYPVQDFNILQRVTTEVAEAVTMDKWWRQPDQPYPALRYPVLDFNAFQRVEAEAAAETINLDKWWSLTEQPYPAIRYPTPEGLFLPDYARLRDAEFTFTTWWVQPDEPLRLSPLIPEAGLNLPLLEITTVPVTVFVETRGMITFGMRRVAYQPIELHPQMHLARFGFEPKNLLLNLKRIIGYNAGGSGSSGSDVVVGDHNDDHNEDHTI